MDDKDIRWQQRFASFSKALSQLEKFVAKGKSLNDMEEQKRLMKLPTIS